MDKTTILVIDDDRIILKTMSNILTEEGFVVVTASTGEEALKKIRENVYDHIFMDLNIPDIHGIDILKEIRKIEPDATVSIITGYGTVDSAIMAMKLNAADYILKPLDSEQILQSIRIAIKRKELEKEILKRIPKPKVLLVASKDDIIAKINVKLQEEKIQVETVSSINDAIMELRNDISINTVICDLGKKEIDGNAFLSKIKAISREIVFLPLTSMPDVNEAVMLMKEGAFDYLIKPVKVEDLLDSLKQAWQSQNQSFLNKQLLSYLQKINEEIDMAYKAYRKVTEKNRNNH